MHCSTPLFDVKKRFADDKERVVTYNISLWRKAEQFFLDVEKARKNGEDLKRKVVDDYYLLSTIFSKNKQRYTGLHQMTDSGKVVANSGVNLTDEEWEEFTKIFPKLNSLLPEITEMEESASKYRRLQGPKPMIKVYNWVWEVDDNPFHGKGQSSKHYCYELAEMECQELKPICGLDYPSDMGEAQFKIFNTEIEPPPNTAMMKTAFLFHIDKNLKVMMQKHCKACQKEDGCYHSDDMGCRDYSLSSLKRFFPTARSQITHNQLLTGFDLCRQKMGLTPVFATNMAQAALEWLENDILMEDLSNDFLKLPSIRPIYDILDNFTNVRDLYYPKALDLSKK